METVSGANNWRLTVRRCGDGIEILRAVTCDTAASLPETVLGLPVTALGRHALSAGDRTAAGEEVHVTCGAEPQEGWDNRSLRTLSLPRSLRRVGDYAFLNCAALRELRLYDGIVFWGGAALMNCRSLDTFHLTRVGEEQGESLAYFADELSRELDVTIVMPGGETARLIFPEYREIYEENCPAHHFDYNISGAGYPYHYCFRHKKLRIKDFDALWEAYLAMEHEADTALRLAWWRLRCPAELEMEAGQRYTDYLRAHGAEAARWLLERRDGEGLAFLLRTAELSPEALAQSCELARQQGQTEAVALLLEAQRFRRPAARKRFDL